MLKLEIPYPLNSIYCDVAHFTRSVSESLIRTFMFLGFVPVTPGTQQLAVSGDVMYLAYTTDSSGDSE